MSKEFKVPRSVQQIQQDYVQLTTKAGDLQYKIHVSQSDLGLINQQLKDLNFEYIAAQQELNRLAEEAKAKAAAEAKQAEKPVAEVVSINKEEGSKANEA